MPELFWRMMKEEWRIHSTMFGQISFALFPVMIFGIVWMSAFLLPMLHASLPQVDLAFLAYAIFLSLGFMVGGFGLLGNEMMNRRFGQASLLVYSARSLPLSERFIFANFVIKDTVYYLLLWVFPFCFGYIAASPFTGASLQKALLLLPTLALSFISGLCTIFLLSTLYVRSKAACWAAILAVSLSLGYMVVLNGSNPALNFPPYMLYMNFSWGAFIVACLMLAALFSLSLLLFSPEQGVTTKQYRGLLRPLIHRFRRLPNPPLTAKDFVDLHRSGIGIGQAIFSFLLPLIAIFLFLSLIDPYLPAHGFFILFSLITGVVASTMYTWVTEFDSFGAYACLPVATSTLIQSKVTTFAILQAIPAVFIAAAAFLTGEGAFALPAIVFCLSSSFFGAGVMAYLCGLSPGVLIYNVNVLFTYLVVNGAVFAILSALSFANPLFASISVVLLVPALLFVERAMSRWDSVDPIGF
ncbi:MAG: hypothetical protein QHG99_02125 [Methanomicrobiales archaeon]|nr:hypothetical protein [Methanomicrobiales archaeon]